MNDDDLINNLISGTPELDVTAAKLSIEQRVKQHLYGDQQPPPQFSDLLQMRAEEIVDDVNGISANELDIDRSTLCNPGVADQSIDQFEVTAPERVREPNAESDTEERPQGNVDTLNTSAVMPLRTVDQITLTECIEQIVAIMTEILEQQANKKHELNESVAAAVAVGKAVELQLGDVETKLGSIRNLCDATRINFDYAKGHLDNSTALFKTSAADTTQAFSTLSARTIAAERTSILIIAGVFVVVAAIAGWFAGNRSGDSHTLGNLNDTSAMLACSGGKPAVQDDGTTACLISSDGGAHYVAAWKIHK